MNAKIIHLTKPAVSVLNLCSPTETGLKLAHFAKSISNSEKPTSGPIKMFTS